jgi:hypothetical protein
VSRLTTKQRRARARGRGSVVTMKMLRDLIVEMFEEGVRPWRSVPVGRCPRCGAPWYTLTGFCGGCR